MNLMHLYRTHKQSIADLAALAVRVNMLYETIAALTERLKAMEQPASQKGEAHGEVPVKRKRGRPRKVASGD